MKPARAFAVTIAVILFSACPAITPEYRDAAVRANGLFDQDGIQLLAIETVYRTIDPTRPYWSDYSDDPDFPPIKDYRTRIHLGVSGGLGDFQLILEWDDSHGESGQGWVQTAAFDWYRPPTGKGKLGFAANSLPVIRNLDTGTRQVLPAPSAADQSEIFWQDNLVPEPRPPAMDVRFSPGGTYVAVWYEVAYSDETFADFRFRTALAVHDYESGALLGVWSPSLELPTAGLPDGVDPEVWDFQIFPPSFSPALPEPPPPAIAAASPVASLSRSRFHWLSDSGILLAAADYSSNQENPTRYAWSLGWIESGGTLIFSVASEETVPKVANFGPGRAFSKASESATPQLLVTLHDSNGDPESLGFHNLDSDSYTVVGQNVPVAEAEWIY